MSGGELDSDTQDILKVHAAEIVKLQLSLPFLQIALNLTFNHSVDLVGSAHDIYAFGSGNELRRDFKCSVNDIK